MLVLFPFFNVVVTHATDDVANIGIETSLSYRIYNNYDTTRLVLRNMKVYKFYWTAVWRSC